jgi:hypothetical protein
MKWLVILAAAALVAGAACDGDDGTGGTGGAGATGTGTDTGGTGGSTASGGSAGSGGEVPVISCGSDALFAGTHDLCDSMDATGDDGCFCMLGYAWDGAQCVGISGCACTGADCNKLTQTPEECATDHASCGGPSGFECGSAELHAAEHTACVAMDVQGDEECYCMLGFYFDGTDCLPLTGCECAGADCDKLGLTLEDCVAQHETCPITPPDFGCGSEALYAHPHAECAAMDAEAIDPCFCMLGYAWDGSACVMLGGCECVGADCDKLFETVEACDAAHASCS